MDDRCCCLHAFVRKYIIFEKKKKNGSRILVLDRSEIVFALLKLFSMDMDSLYFSLDRIYLINLIIHRNYGKDRIFEIVSLVLYL